MSGGLVEYHATLKLLLNFYGINTQAFITLSLIQAG
jgi:hypothetical protein